MDPEAFLDEFRAEATDHLRRLDHQLLRLEREPRAAEPVGEMFRSAHTIKGGAAVLGLSSVSELAHALEDVLGAMRDGRRAADTATTELLFRAFDALRELVDSARPGDSALDDSKRELAARLRRAARTEQTHDPVVEDASSGPRALAIDDSATVRILLKMLLSDAGFEVDVVRDGHTALAQARTRRYDLVVTAIETEGLDGFELAAALRAMPEYQTLPIVLTSTNDRPQLHQRVEELGLQGLLPKGSLGDRRLVDFVASLLPTRPSDVEHDSSETVQRILLVDDSAMLQHFTQTLLEALGYQVEVADDGKQALDAFDRGPYAAVLMDCHMPEMDGFEAAAAIREREPPGRRIPIVAMTGGTGPADREKCLEAGMDDYLEKPVKLHELAECLQRWIQAPRSD